MAIRETITTISTKDMTLNNRRKELKKKLGVNDEDIYIAGVVALENSLKTT